ncbi:hypothetical protein HBB16_17420 [Pseudonocardia sp. MCCB 268]|nr:hypothetical protein [Pseudonocardia cytotoxica]
MGLGRFPTTDVAVELCHSGAQRDLVVHRGRHDHLRWAAHRRRAGSPGEVLDAPGGAGHQHAVDLHGCAPLRTERGPVYVFNPVRDGRTCLDSHLRPADGLRDGDWRRARHRHDDLRDHAGRAPETVRVLGRASPRVPGRVPARRRARRGPRSATSSRVAGADLAGRATSRACAQVRRRGVRPGRPAVHHHQRPHLVVDHLGSHAGARLAHQPGGRAARSGREFRRRRAAGDPRDGVPAPGAGGADGTGLRLTSTSPVVTAGRGPAIPGSSTRRWPSRSTRRRR